METLKKEIVIVGVFILILWIGVCWTMTWDNFLDKNQMYVAMFGGVMIVPLLMWLLYSIIKKS